MDYIAVLKADIAKGFSKSQLELLIGLPKNNLTEILKGNRQLSQKSKLKIEQWEASEKPHPISMEITKRQSERIQIQDLTKPNKVIEAVKPLGTKKTNAVINTTKKSAAENDRLKEYQDELDLLKDKNSQLAISRKKWLIKQIESLKK